MNNDKENLNKYYKNKAHEDLLIPVPCLRKIFFMGSLSSPYFPLKASYPYKTAPLTAPQSKK